LKTEPIRVAVFLRGCRRRREIQAVIASPNFAVHRDIHSVGNRAIADGFGWNVTHIPTGLLLLHNCHTRAKAIKAAKELETIYDKWPSITSRNYRKVFPMLVIIAVHRLRVKYGVALS